MSLLALFLTGLTTGGISCLAVQGGLLASLIANQKKHVQEKTTKLSLSMNDFWIVSVFLLAKLLVHTIAGALLGQFGETIAISYQVQLVFQLLVALFLVATAMNLLNVHPIFRYVAIQPPRWLFKIVRKSAKSQAFFAPALLGALTIFIPCGVTQSVELLAINSANAIMGASMMFFFVLGTMPLFMFIGLTTAKLSDAWSRLFNRIAAAVILLMALYSLNGVAVVLDSPFAVTFTPGGSDLVQETGGVQRVEIEVKNNGYVPNYITVKKGVPVELTLRSNETYSCALSFVLREFGIQTFLKSTDEQTFTFTPTKAGSFTYTCSMGMYTGVLEVK